MTKQWDVLPTTILILRCEPARGSKVWRETDRVSLEGRTPVNAGFFLLPLWEKVAERSEVG
jgi:hypothetical protein